MLETAPSICVFCGARPGRDAAYGDLAEEMGRSIAEAGMRLVYGAGNAGLMGRVAEGAIRAGGETFGVIPEHLIPGERARQDLTHLVVTETMHERKKLLFTNSDAIVTLPGGAGSLDEFFEVLTWRQIGLHEKPLYLLNPQLEDGRGYWDPLLEMLERVVGEGFADPGLTSSFTVAQGPAALMARLRADLSRASASAE
ncbi:TIGR00730 family Rossman fold protein [Paracoccaceae bacterium GXU_MW_L88]